MTIQEDDFIMTLAGNDAWDLELLHIIKPKGKEPRQEFKNVGYGMNMKRCIHKIILHRMELKQETYSLKEFLKNYSIEVNKLDHYLKDLQS